METQLNRHTVRYLLVTFGIFISAFFWLVVATYPSFFLFNPWDNPSAVRAVLLTAMMIAWILLSSAPVLIFASMAAGRTGGLKFLPVVSLAWPVLLIVNHVSLAIVEHHWYTGYLVQYPIFIATDILLPVLLVAVWLELRPHDHPVRHAVAKQPRPAGNLAD